MLQLSSCQDQQPNGPTSQNTGLVVFTTVQGIYLGFSMGAQRQRAGLNGKVLEDYMKHVLMCTGVAVAAEFAALFTANTRSTSCMDIHHHTTMLAATHNQALQHHASLCSERVPHPMLTAIKSAGAGVWSRSLNQSCPAGVASCNMFSYFSMTGAGSGRTAICALSFQQATGLRWHLLVNTRHLLVMRATV